ncbi:hypothetical protein [Sphingomonas sp. CFBP 8760]|uniref:hypothetical protein n=1 Tax=Sphingomonas sp. CFBP 8760 TaxID=2775282 RepID=UPI001785594F|nr:hypothetical protein [Sphingomonas sp. CFBP 8760]MBD8546225.1 hypothetical protein [Sphingomonas sp. CFBP 8760]
MREPDQSYYQRRAEAELAHAQQSTLKPVVQAHYELAEAYLRKVSLAERAEGATS